MCEDYRAGLGIDREHDEADRPIRHHVIDSGHHQAEQAPGPVAAALLGFLSAAR